MGYKFQRLLPAVFELFVTSLLSWCISQSAGVGTNSSQKAGQREKGDDLLVGYRHMSWNPSRGCSRASGRESGMGLLGNAFFLLISVSASLSMPIYPLSLRPLSHGSIIPGEGTNWPGKVQDYPCTSRLQLCGQGLHSTGLGHLLLQLLGQ